MKKLITSCFFIFLCGATAFACQGGEKPSIQDGKMVVATVDIPTLLAFHPAMRSFDFRERKFIAEIPSSPPEYGVAAFSQAGETVAKIRKLEEDKLKQADRLNSVLMDEMARRLASESAKIQDSAAVTKEREVLKAQSQEHKKLLASLAGKALGEFPTQAYGPLPEEKLKRIMDEINWAVEEAAKEQSAAFVLNSGGNATPTPDENLEPLKDSASGDNDILQKFSIHRLADLEALLVENAATSSSPIGKAAPKGIKGQKCGGHMESVVDPQMLKTLSGEFYDNRLAFCPPFLKNGVGKLVWKGVMKIENKNITLVALGNLFKLYKTRKLEQDAAFEIIKERMGYK